MKIKKNGLINVDFIIDNLLPIKKMFTFKMRQYMKEKLNLILSISPQKNGSNAKQI